jgi:hypothetical protein
MIDMNILKIVSFMNGIKNRLCVWGYIGYIICLVLVCKNLIFHFEISQINILIAIFQIAVINGTILATFFLVYFVRELTIIVCDGEQGITSENEFNDIILDLYHGMYPPSEFLLNIV